MVSTAFTIASGIFIDEQDLLGHLDTFMTSTIGGWTQVKVITDTAGDKNIAYTGIGSSPGTYDTNHVRLRATSNNLEFHVLSLFDPATDTDSDDVNDASGEGQIPITTSGTYWFIGNEDTVHISIEYIGAGTTYHGGFGTWITYYSEEEDPKPYFLFGHSASSATFADTDRCRSYGPFSWGSSGESAGTTYSGTSRNYRSEHNTQLNVAAPQPRTGEPYLFEPIFYHSSNFEFAEVRGEIPGLFIVGGSSYGHGNIITVSGIGSINGDYYIHKYDDNTCWAIGKITGL